MFTETPRYVGFPNQVWCESSFAFHNFEKMFKNKAPFFVSTFSFKDKDTPIVDNLFFDIDSYYSVRLPWRNVKRLKDWAYHHDVPYIHNFSVSGDTPLLVKVEEKLLLLSITDIISKFKEGKYIEVLSYDNDNGVTFSTVYDYLVHDDYLYDIYHEQSGVPLELTQHHSIFKWNDSEIIKVKKEDIKEGDFLVTFRKIPDFKCKDNVVIKQTYTYRNKSKTEEVKITDSLLRLMGYYVAEGHTLENGFIGLSFNIKETKYHGEVKESIKKLTPAILSTKEEININESSPHPTVNVVSFSSQKYKPFFVEQCGSTQEFRHVPPFLFHMSKEKFMIFLTAYLNGDGSYKDKYDIRAKTISKRLAIELLWLCKVHNISCSLEVNDYRDKRPEFNTKIVYVISINKRDLYQKEKNNKYHPETRDKLIPVDALRKVYHQCKPKQFERHRNEQMTLSKERANCTRISKVLNWFDETKSIPYNKDSKRIVNNYKKLVEREDIGFLKIRKITDTRTDKEKVYDISVVGTENFFCGAYPILHKNSGGKGFHFYMLTKPIVPVSETTQKKISDLMYSIQMAIVKETKIEAYDEPTFARLRFLMRYPTSLYIRKDEDTGAFTTNDMYCRNLSDKQFDGGVKKIRKVVTEPGVVPKTPKSDITLYNLRDMLPNFKMIKREEKQGPIAEKIFLQRAGMNVPPVEGLGAPCLKEIVSHSHPTHFERIEVVAFMKFLGYTDIAINAFIRQRKWTRYKYAVSSYQIRTINPRFPKCSFLRKSYGHLCNGCPLKRRKGGKYNGSSDES